MDRCELPDGTVQGLRFPLLKVLELYDVTISEHSLHEMVFGCTLLDSLKIYGGLGSRCARINPVSLRRIEVGSQRQSDEYTLRFDQLVIENAPCLNKLLRCGYTPGMLISVISAPMLEALSFDLNWYDSTELTFGSMLIQGLQVDNPATVRILAVNMKNVLEGSSPCRPVESWGSLLFASPLGKPGRLAFRWGS